MSATLILMALLGCEGDDANQDLYQDPTVFSPVTNGPTSTGLPTTGTTATGATTPGTTATGAPTTGTTTGASSTTATTGSVELIPTEPPSNYEVDPSTFFYLNGTSHSVTADHPGPLVLTGVLPGDYYATASRSVTGDTGYGTT